MKKIVSKGIIVFVAVLMLTVGLSYKGVMEADAYSFTGQDVNTTTDIMYNGVDTGVDYTYVHLGSGGSAGWGANRKINIVEANLAANNAIGFETINNGPYLNSSAPLTQVVAGYDEDGKEILAAVNGDWMTWANSLGASVSTNYRVSFSSLITDGEILCSQMTSAEQNADFYTFGVTTDREVVMGKPTITTTVKNVSTGSSFSATGINRAPVNNTIVVFNNRLSTSNFANKDSYEIAIQASSTRFPVEGSITGTVVGIYPSGTSSRASMDDNTIIITARGNKVSTLSGRFSVGNTVSISTSIYDSMGNNTKWDKCEEAIGGQCLVMKNGSINNTLSGSSTGQYPTNILGYKSDGTIMMTMVTSDTNGNYVGLNFRTQIANFCSAVGYNTCLLLDGGGSTTMVTLEDGQYIERACYSDGSIRSTWNSCAIVYDVGNSTLPSSIKGTAFDAEYYYYHNKDLQSAKGKDPEALLKHFIEFGIKEGRQASNLFSIDEYINFNGDLKAAFGFDSNASDETKHSKRLDAMNHFASYGAFKDESLRLTSDSTATGLHDEFYARIQLTNASLNFSLTDTSVIAYTPSTAAAQVWHFQKQSDGSYKIINTKNNYVLEVANGTKTSGASVQISATDDNSLKQRWNIYEKIDYSGAVKGYILRSAATPACVLTVASSSPTASTAIQNNICTHSDTQVFKFEITEVVDNTPPSDIGTGFYAQILSKLNTSKGASVSGTNIVLNDINNISSQVWYFEKQSDGSYKIKNQSNGYLLTVEGSLNASGTNIGLAAADGSTGQLWFLYESDGYYELRPACARGCAMDVNGALTANGTNIGIYTKNDTTAQRFSIYKGEYLNLSKAENIGTDFIGHITTSSGNKGVSFNGIDAVTENADANSKKQLFYFILQEDGSYKITNLKNRYCLGITGNVAIGEDVAVFAEQYTSQKWFIHCKEGKYILRAAGAEDLVAGTSGTNIQLGTFDVTSDAYFFNIANKGAAEYEVPAVATGSVLSDAQIKAIYESLCATNTSCNSIGEAALKQTIAQYVAEAYNLGVKEVKALALCVNIRYLGSSSELSRVLTKSAGNYTADAIYASLLTDVGSQVGANRQSHWTFYNMLQVKL